MFFPTTFWGCVKMLAEMTWDALTRRTPPAGGAR